LERVNVVITAPVGKDLLNQIKSVSPRLKVTDLTNLARYDMIDRFLTEPKSPEDIARINTILADVEIISGFRLPEHLVQRAPKLKWYQAMTAGIDWFVEEDLFNSKVIITTVGGIHTTVIPEFVMAQILTLAKQIPVLFDSKRKKQWHRYLPMVLKGKTLGILGLGNIGKEVARLAKAFDMKVIASRRSVKEGTHAKYVDLLLPAAEMSRLLAESDFILVALPLTHDTEGIIGAKELNLIKPSAYLINIARGSIIDEPSLVKALEKHKIAGAALDVFAAEPLPANSKLWELPNVIISPHISGSMPDYMRRATGILCKNLARYLEGKRLINVVNKKRGY
jgi:phosphoglycerate dehydrogenase-like enzyme